MTNRELRQRVDDLEQTQTRLNFTLQNREREIAKLKEQREGYEQALELSAAVLAGLRWGFRVEGFWGAVLLLMIVADLGMIIPVWMLLKTRLKEIEGGEEDAASQY